MSCGKMLKKGALRPRRLSFSVAISFWCEPCVLLPSPNVSDAAYKTDYRLRHVRREEPLRGTICRDVF